MSYMSPQTGRQYVLVTIPGSGFIASSADEVLEPGDVARTSGQVIAYALPQ